LVGGTKKTHAEPQDIWSPGIEFNPGPLEYEAGVEEDDKNKMEEGGKKIKVRSRNEDGET
jgi:hypothetical protein